jgi:CheY-like chemotaxis protein
VLVLVVDDDPVARMTHLALLSRRAEFTAIGAESVQEARALIAQTSPAAAIIDLQLPDGNGLEVMSMLDQHTHTSLVIVVSAHLDAGRQLLPRNPRLHRIGKPPQLRELVQIVRSAPLPAEAAAPFSLRDYVQLAALGHNSALLVCSAAESRGELHVFEGQPWSASDDQGSGAAAFRRLAQSPTTRVLVRPAPEVRPPRNLTEPAEVLLRSEAT